ncbi:extracellular solute-binding protein [Paenibacillus solisilvae]|uniref:Extracellular solute-binding protein n=1 Tax=Paenibacillus solisilvae TaxID=2486751 RepID=A0ABW0W093_9BACL
MNKKMTAILASLLIISVLLLAACSKSSQDGNQAGETNTPATNSEATNSETTPDQSQGAPVKFSFMTQDSWDLNFPISNGLPVLEEFEKRTNVDIEWVTAAPGEQYTTLQKTRMASNIDLPCLVNLQSFTESELLNLVDQGTIIPWDDLIEKYGPNIKKNLIEGYPDLYKTMIAPDGKLYWMRSVAGGPMSFLTPVVRTDWMEKAGITKVDTTDDFHNMLKKFQEIDANGNGKKDEVFIDYQDGLLRLSESFGVKGLTSQAEGSFSLGEDGKVVNAWVTDGTKQWLAWVSQMYKEGLIDPQIFNLQPEDFVAKVNSNTMSAMQHAPYYGNYLVQGMSDAGIKGANYKGIMPLAGPDGKRSILLNPIALYGYYAITSTCKAPEAVVKYIDFIFSDEGQLILNNGVEGTDWVRKTDGTIDNSMFLEKSKSDPLYKTKTGVGHSSLLKLEINDYDGYNRLFSYLTPYGWDFDYTKKLWEDVQQYKYDPLRLSPPTPEEVKEFDSVPKDLWIYMNEMAQKFVTGKEPLDNWDAFVAKTKELGLDKATAVMQKRSDRYKSLT